VVAPWLEIWLEAGREGRVFTYANPAGDPVGIGDLVQVRLQGRRQNGLVVGLPSACPDGLEADRVRPIERVLQAAAVDPQWRALIEAVASQCHTSAFRTLRTALPPGWLGARGAERSAPQRPRSRVVLRNAGLSTQGRLGERQRALLQLLQERGGEIELGALTGLGFHAAVLRSLERRGLVERELIDPRLTEGGLRAVDPGRRLTSDQAVAVQAINGAAPGASLLLWGVTGAGKSEVYLQAAAHTLAQGSSVLLLTPEIGLVPQLLDRCRERFGSTVLEWHSGVGPAERIRCWRQCLQAGSAGHPQLVVGTRSAVFLPLMPLGLIVLDEEHDSSYKQVSPMPCYHARDVAQLRANLGGTRVLLGSATPSLESWLACGEGRIQLLRLPERIARRPLPAVRLVDMRHELAEGHRRLLSRALMSRLETLRDRGDQAVVLVPRRGYRSFLGCRSCGQVVHCPHCDVALTVHRHSGGDEWLRCHWCDHREAMAAQCGHCGSTAFKPFGAGTQRVMEQLAQELEGLRLLRFDRDTTRGRDGHRRLLERFAAGEADVLVGTQMLAKGMDLPRVTLAAVLAADGLLHRPDLRAGEQCLQLLLQLAGRGSVPVRCWSRPMTRTIP
jgi:primosomal protein N' (replication factor Y)